MGNLHAIFTPMFQWRSVPISSGFYLGGKVLVLDSTIAHFYQIEDFSTQKKKMSTKSISSR